MNIQYLYVCDKGLTNTQNIAIAFKKGKSISWVKFVYTLFEHMNFLQGYFKVRRVLNH